MQTMSILALACATVFATSVGAQTSPSNTRQPLDPEGLVRVGFAGPGAILDPHRLTQAGEGTYITLIYDRLTRINSDNKPVPMLATRWSFAADGSYLDLDLRNDVSFHDGTKFNAAAVKANIERAKTVQRSTVSGLLEPIVSVEVVTEYKVRLRLAPDVGANLPYILATHAGAMISPKALADPARNLVLEPGDAGSGPFVVTRFKPNESAMYERAPKPSWDRGAGLAKRIEISFAGNDVRLRAFQTGALDAVQLTGAVNSQGRAMAAASPKEIEARLDQNGTAVTLMLRAERPLLSDVRVRRAIAQAIDREAVARVVQDNNCPAANQIFQTSHWAHDPKFVDFKFDPVAARALVEAAGAKGLAIEILGGRGGLWDQSAVLVQSMLKDIGLDPKVVAIPPADTVNGFKAKDKDALVYSTGGEAHPALWFNEQMVRGFALTPTAEMASFKAILDRAQSPKSTQADQERLYREASRKAAEYAVIVPICWVQQLYLNRKTVLNGDSLLLRAGATRDYRFLAVAKR